VSLFYLMAAFSKSSAMVPVFRWAGIVFGLLAVAAWSIGAVSPTAPVVGALADQIQAAGIGLRAGTDRRHRTMGE